jgi:uncharacterized membrane protein
MSLLPRQQSRPPSFGEPVIGRGPLCSVGSQSHRMLDQRDPRPGARPDSRGECRLRLPLFAPDIHGIFAHNRAVTPVALGRQTKDTRQSISIESNTEPWNMFDQFSDLVNILVCLLEALGIGVILGGFVFATAVYLTHLRLWTTHQSYLDYRRRSGRGLILGLEFLVAADIIKTVAVDYTMESVLMLGLIIIFRTFLVFALTLEVEGRLPWTAERESDLES